MSSVLTCDELLKQEQEYRFREFDFNAAWETGQTIRMHALNHRFPVVTEVYAFQQPLFFAALPGSAPDNIGWMKRKRNTVLRYAHSFLYVGLINEINHCPMDQQSYINQSEYCDHGGSFPRLHTSGAVTGAVSVSGLPTADDHALVLLGIAR